MASAYGSLRTTDLTVGVKLDFEDFINTITPTDVPLQGLNGADGRSVLSNFEIFEIEYQWQDETLLVPLSSLGATALTADTFITVAAGDQTKFQTGDVLVVGTDHAASGEVVYVTGYGTTANTLTVTRQFISTGTFATSIQLAQNSVVKGVGMALPEGAQPGFRGIDRVNQFNYTQIFGPTGVSVTGSENAVQKYGLTGTEFDHQGANRLRELFVGREYSLSYGQRFQSADQRTSGGLAYWITKNVDDTSTQLTDTSFLASMQNAYTQGGHPDRVLLGVKQAANLSTLNSGNIRYAQAENIRGQVVDYYDTDFGRVMKVMSRQVESNDAFFFNRDQAAIGWLRPPTFEMLAKLGDYTQGQVVCESGFRFKRQQHSARMSNLS